MLISESQNAPDKQSAARRFALGASLFYASTLGMAGTYLPFFPVWLGAIGIDAAWIGVITAAPALTRFTVLPFVTALAERHAALRGAMIGLAVATAAGFAALGAFRDPIAVLAVFALTACAWTPISALTDGYALKGVARYGIDYGPMRLWGSAAFIVGALVCGATGDRIAPAHLIWVIVAVAVLSAGVSLALAPLDAPPVSRAGPRAASLLRRPAFLAIVGASALIQASHAAYYSFSAIAWRASGLGGTAIAVLWSLGVIAEIAVFALSPRFALAPATLVIIGGVSAALRWLATAAAPRLELLAAVQLMHGLSFGVTQIGTVALTVRAVPHQWLASAQGYLVAALGAANVLALVASGLLYAQWGEGVYVAMAAMAFAGAAVMALALRRLGAAGFHDADG